MKKLIIKTAVKAFNLIGITFDLISFALYGGKSIGMINDNFAL